MHFKSAILSLVLFFILLHSCKPNEQKNTSTEGIWESIGYGKILKIDSSSYEFFDKTSISCLPSKKGEISEVKNSLELTNDTLIIKRGFSYYYYTRLNEFPDLCKKNKENTNDPFYNFEVFAETYKNNYAYFELNGINWNSLYKAAKEKINSNTTEVELYLVMQEMINSINDNHGYIEPTDNVYELIDEVTLTKEEEEEEAEE
jgi:hypothetical protein